MALSQSMRSWPECRSDAQRNCISNVRPEGLSYDEAAFRLAWLMGEALRRGVSGIGLKDESDLAPQRLANEGGSEKRLR